MTIHAIFLRAIALGNRVVAGTLMKRMTSANAFQRIPSAFPSSVLSDRLNGVFGAGGKKPAIVKRKKRGNEKLVQPYGYDQEVSHELSENLSCSSLRREEMAWSMDSRIRRSSTGVERTLKRKTTLKRLACAGDNSVRRSFCNRYDSLIHRRTLLRAAAARMFLVTEKPIRIPVPPAESAQ